MMSQPKFKYQNRESTNINNKIDNSKLSVNLTFSTIFVAKTH